MSRELLEVALTAARAAATLVTERARGGVEVAATKSSSVDVVTEADRASEELIRALIAEDRPDDAFFGEEGDSVAGSTGVRWIIDPIDGTVNYLYQLPEYAVSIAAEVTDADGPRVVAGVVVNAATGAEYTAWEEPDGRLCAERDGRPLAVRGPAPLSERLVGTGFSYDAGVRAQQAAALVRLLPRVRDVRRMGSCALDLCHVAEGTLDGYLEEGVNLWDHAAGALVAQGAGARFATTTGVAGRTLVVCAPEHGFEELWAAVHEAGFAAP
ncbi:inositol monophosphatase family protein [Nocardioides sp. SYSU D00038]|uniref:inositol monophosphatase family protein n=1 Tax=Nocardioides sp. SYSU D00038 TaxID=2812554 RepID=UPI0027DB9D6F|nr:inositol monophosphatase family protein [Nocardioides sp. SYSU D00038]